MYCILQYYAQFKQALAEHKLGLKVLAIKLVIFLSFWQTIAISLATGSTFHIVSPNAKLAYPDLKVGIPSLLLCIEMALFAFLHLWSFPYAQYKQGSKTTFYPSPNPTLGIPLLENERGPNMGGFAGLKALGDALNVWDIVKAFGRGIRWLFVGAKHRHDDPSYQLKADTRYPMPNNGKSTDHLPIANQFRRSTFGLPGAPGDPMPEESAGLIANAQPDPGNGHRGQTGRYQDSALHPQAYDENVDPNPSSHTTTYAPYDDDRGDIGAAATSYYAYNPSAPYDSTEAGPVSGTRTTATSENPRNSTQVKVGNALWGHPNQPHQGPS
jgi:hypothetical protein